MAASPLCRQPAWLACCGVQHPSQVRCNSFGRLTALFLHLELAPRHVAESYFFKVSEGFGDCQGERKQISFTFTCLIECHMAASPLCRQLARLARYEVQHPSQVWCKSFGRPIAFFLHLELALRHFAQSCFFKVSEGFGDCQGERKQISFTFTCLIECHMAASPLCRQLARLARYEVQHPSQVWCKSFGRPIAFFLHLELALRHFAESCVFQRG